MAVATLFAFLATARIGVPRMVNIDYDGRLPTQSGDVLVPLRSKT